MSRLYSNKWGARHHPETVPGYESDESTSAGGITTTSTSTIPTGSSEVRSSSVDISTDASGSVALVGGNTSGDVPVGPPKRNRSRNWSFTIFGSDLQAAGRNSDSLLSLAPGRVLYIVLGYEVSRTTGRAHIQGFLRTQHPREFGGIKKLLGQGKFAPHIEQSAPSASSISYCKKSGNWEERGNKPEFSTVADRSESGISEAVLRKRQLYADLKDGANPATLIDDQPEEYAFIHSISKYAAASRVRSYSAQVLYLHGTTGIGKTTTTQLCLDSLGITYYKKAPGCKWFCGYNFEPVIIFDEFAGAIPLHRFNALCDPKPPLLEIKGAQVPNAASHYIILSNRSPDEQYQTTKAEKPDEWAAYRRRIISTHHLVRTNMFEDNSDLEPLRADIKMIVSVFVSDLVLDLP